MQLPVSPPVEPMLAKLARSMPAAAGLIFEPKWDGFRCIVFRDGDELTLQSRNLKPLNRYFPEIIQPLLDALPQRCAVDGELVVADRDGNGLDFDALQQRIHPAESRVNMLAESTPSSFVAFDVLADGDESLMDRPFSERRDRLVAILRPNRSVHLTPATGDADVAQRWFTAFEGAGLDGIVAKPADGAYQPKKRALIKVKHERTADCVVAGYRVHKDGNGVGSLLLGLYGDESPPELHSVGVCASFATKFRSELLTELAPLTKDAVDGHPWQPWIEAQAQHANSGTTLGGGSRWNAGKDLSFVPIRAERVLEVTFGQLENRRFRHGVGFVRWRPDRTPESCRFEQLDIANPVNFNDLLAEGQH